MKEQMIKKINSEIAMAKMYYDMYKENDPRMISKIYGMIEMLEIVTGKKYGFNENGVFEK